MSLADRITALEDALAGVSVHFGSEFIDLQERTPPSIVFVPATDNFEERAQQSLDDDDRRQIVTAVSTVVARVWAKGDDAVRHDDYRQTEVLVARLIKALRKTAPGQFSLGQGEWVDKEGQALFEHGRVYLLPVTFDNPVLDPDPSHVSATITALQPGTHGLEGTQPLTVAPPEVE